MAAGWVSSLPWLVSFIMWLDIMGALVIVGCFILGVNLVFSLLWVVILATLLVRLVSG